MKKLKLEELEVTSLTTSLQDESAEELKGGTTPTTVTFTGPASIIGSISIMVTLAGIGYLATGGGSGGSY